MGSKPVNLSASRGAAILGVSPYQTPFEAWQRLMEDMHPGFNADRGYTMPDPVDNASVRWGSAFEDDVVILAEESRNTDHGVSDAITDRERLFSHPEHDYITCHIDGRYESDGVLHEGKTTHERAFYASWGDPAEGRLPRQYQVQIQHQLMCTGAPEAILSVLVFPRAPDEFEALGWRVADIGDETPPEGVTLTYLNPLKRDEWAFVLYDMGYFHQYHVEAAPDAQEKMLAKYVYFWKNHVLKAVPPEPVNYEDIKRMFPEPKGTVVVPESVADLLAEYKSITEQIGTGGVLEERRKQIKTDVLKQVLAMDATIDDDSREKTVIRDEAGKKVGSFYRTKSGSLTFRV